MTRKTRNTKTGYIASIIGGNLYFEDALQCAVDDDSFKDIISDGYTNSIRVISLDSTWVLNVWITPGAKIKETINFEMTIRREVRGQRAHWYAYRRVAGTLHKRYVGDDESITQNKLLEVAQKMPSL
jgi:hypothetical protein